MSLKSRLCQVGDKVTTDFSRAITEHRITEVLKPAQSGSGVMFKVDPIIRGSAGDWIDADWFEVAP